MLNNLKEIIENNYKDNILYKKGSYNISNESFRNVFWNYHPLTDNYYFEGNPSYYSQYAHIYDIGRFPIVMFRDGFLGVLSFFLNNPKPSEELSTFFLVHKRYEKLIPKFWRNQVAVYNIEERVQNVSKTNDLCLYGLGVEEYLLHNSIEKISTTLKNTCNEFQNIFAFVPTRSSELSTDMNKFSNFHLTILRELFVTLGERCVIFEDGEKLKNKIRDLKSFNFHSLDHNFFISSDNFLDHYCFSHGGKPLISTGEKLENDSIEYNLSLNHKIVISEVGDIEDIFCPFFVKYKLKSNFHTDIKSLFQNEVVQEFYKTNFS